MKVLCVDDEPEILELMADFLELLGVDVVTTTDARQGLEIYMTDSNDYDAVITDMKMPYMSGLDLLKELRSRGQNVPIIMASGQFDEDLDKLSKECGITAIIAKPFTLAKFKKVLEETVGSEMTAGK